MASKFALIIALVLALMFTASSETVLARPICHSYEGHEVCIKRIKRSAKYYWEYYVELSTDGKSKPLETYDCRHRQRITEKGEKIAFSERGHGEFICGMVQR